MADPPSNPYAVFAQPDTPSVPVSGANEQNPYAQFVPIDKSPIMLERDAINKGVVQGLSDPFVGGTQAIAHLASTLTPGNQSTQNEADYLDQYVKNREAAYAKNFPGGQEPSIDVGRIIGNVGPGAVVSAAMPGVAAEGLGARALSQGVSGALQGAAQPVDTSQGGYAGTKTGQIATGAVGGAIGAPLAGGAAKTIEGVTNPNTKLLSDAGVTMTPGQLVGGWFKDLEDKFTSIPGLGDAIKSAQRRATDDLNRAAINRSLAPIGESLDPKTPIGYEAIREMGDKISGAYDQVIPNLNWQADPQFVQNVNTIRNGLNLPPEKLTQFDNFVKGQFSKVPASGAIPGNTYKGIESEFKSAANNYVNSSSADDRTLGGGFRAVQTELRSALRRSNPQYADELSNIDSAYADSLRVQGAAQYQGAKEGVFSPAQLSASVKANDNSLRDKAFARGEARMQDLSDAGKSVLGSTVPDSGTAGRGMAAAGLLGLMGGGSEMFHFAPHAVVPAVAAGAAGLGAYSRPGQSLLATLLASRPNIAAPVASVVRRLGTPATTSVLANTLARAATPSAAAAP